MIFTHAWQKSFFSFIAFDCHFSNFFFFIIELPLARNQLSNEIPAVRIHSTLTIGQS